MITLRVSGCAIVQDGKLLLRLRKRDTMYEFPGGTVEKGETLVQAALREVEEEVDCKVIIIKEAASYAQVKRPDLRLKLYVHLARLVEGQVPREMEPQEFGELVWMPIFDYLKYPLASNVKKFCEEYRATL